MPPEVQLLNGSGKIVDQMESEKLPLEDLIVQYEEGMNLVKIGSVFLRSTRRMISKN
jgi:exodeoxyribonuclease VII small subunit